MQEGQTRLAAINGLRALAIVGVVWHHTVYKLWLRDVPAGAIWEPIAALLNSGWLGVNLFFVLSGFVLYLPYAAGRRNAESKSAWIDFYKRRAVRLLPLFYLSLCVFIVADLAAGRGGPGLSEAIAYLTLTFNFSVDTFMPRPNWVLWSLGVEIWFSLLFPLLVLAIARYGIARVLIAVMILSLMMRLIGTLPEFFRPGDRLNPMKDGILGRLDDFLVGMWVCHAYVGNRLDHLRRRWLVAAGLLIGVIACVGWERRNAGSLSALLVPFLHNGVQLGCAALLVAALTTARSWVTVLTKAPIQVIGMMCFSIYVWHGRPIPSLLPPRFDLASFAIYLAVLAAISCLSYRLIEFPRVRPWQRLFVPSMVADQSR